MKTLIAITSALFITVACQKKVEVPVVPLAPTPAVEPVGQQPPQGTTTVGDTEKTKEVECED
jgi:hypothetical protein